MFSGAEFLEVGVRWRLRGWGRRVCELEGRMRFVEGGREEGVGSVDSGGQCGGKGKW